jgi:hypothetical protein
MVVAWLSEINGRVIVRPLGTIVQDDPLTRAAQRLANAHQLDNCHRYNRHALGTTAGCGAGGG